MPVAKSIVKMFYATEYSDAFAESWATNKVDIKKLFKVNSFEELQVLQGSDRVIDGAYAFSLPAPLWNSKGWENRIEGSAEHAVWKNHQPLGVLMSIIFSLLSGFILMILLDYKNFKATFVS
ncbi:hypothetical protein HN954_02575 [bacterium]|nr:hypothetical protein [bacterium]MBT6996289.1 hypothetical protein [bacterium]